MKCRATSVAKKVDQELKVCPNIISRANVKKIIVGSKIRVEAISEAPTKLRIDVLKNFLPPDILAGSDVEGVAVVRKVH